MPSILTISQINKYLGFKIKSDLKLKGIAVKGEVSNFIEHYSSGHLYFTLKDEASSIKAVMFSSNASRLKFKVDNGMKVLCIGNVEVYERDGCCQIIATDIQPVGVGAVHVGIEQLKEKLLKNGIINDKNKKPIPLVPKKISVVTSAGAAALQDIINVTGRRYPMCEINIFPALVQGDNAPKSIAKALSLADNSGADTVILARGGGSVEDLMPFNSEIVAMAVYNCVTPVVTAVGHETDTTIVDYVSDMRAPTPSAAAEICTPDKNDIIAVINNISSRLDKSFDKLVESKLSRLNNADSKIRLKSPVKRLEDDLHRLEFKTSELLIRMDRYVSIIDYRLKNQHTALNALSPFNVLERGYSIATRNDTVIESTSSLEIGDVVNVKLRNSSFMATVKSVSDDNDKIKE